MESHIKTETFILSSQKKIQTIKTILKNTGSLTLSDFKIHHKATGGTDKRMRAKTDSRHNELINPHVCDWILFDQDFQNHSMEAWKTFHNTVLRITNKKDCGVLSPKWGIHVTPYPTPGSAIFSQEEEAGITRCRGGSRQSRAVTHRDWQLIWQHAQDLSKLKPEKHPAWRGNVHKTPPLGKELLTTSSCWERDLSLSMWPQVGWPHSGAGSTP